MAKDPQAGVSEGDLAFPVEGVDEQRSYSRQRTGTTPDSLNVRAFDPLTDRARGGTRPGLEKLYFLNADDTAVTNYPIQDINQLTTTRNTVTGHYQQFTYTEPAGSGFGIGDGAAGSSVAVLPAAPVASFAMACSCWDADGNVYVTMCNTTTGAVTIYKYDYTGALAWSVASPFTVATGSLRNVAGMTHYRISATSGYLFIAVKPPSGTAYIWRMFSQTGVLVDGAIPFASHHATLAGLNFSTGSINNLAIAGGVLGVGVRATVNNQGFRIYNPTIAPLPIPPGTGTSIPNMLKYLSWGGTGADNNTKVVSDGTNFYAIADVTTNILKKVSAGGTLLAQSTTAYQTAAAGSPTGLDIDTKNGKLVLGSTVAPFVRLVSTTQNASAGLDISVSASPGSAAQWDECGADGNGTFFLWRNSVASNNWMTVDTTLTAVLAMGAFNIPNSSQLGVSVNRGTGALVPPPTAGPVTLVSLLVKGGQVMTFDENGPASITNGTVLNGAAPEIFSAQNGPNMFFVDGSSYFYYKGTTNAMTAWTPTSGSLPLGDNGVAAKLICNWCGRIVLAIGRNIYMSKQFDAFNWNYSPTTTTVQQAFSGNADVAGELGDLITCPVPFNDDTMLFGCDHSIYQLSGDPMDGGKMDRVSEGLGIAFGRPYAFDTQGTLYFFGSDCTVYKMTSGSFPVPISGAIRRRLQNIDLAAVRVRMCWDQFCDGLGVWVTPYDRTEETVNFFWERRTEAWWPEKYGDVNFNPMAVFAFDGDKPEDRRIYLGGQDGYVRRVAVDGGDDDGEAIESFVILGPIKTAQWDNIKLLTLQATLGEASEKVRYGVFWGKHAEEALTAAQADDSKITGTWKAGRNRVSPIDREGFALYVKVSSSDYWTIERITMRFKSMGLVRRRM